MSNWENIKGQIQGQEVPVSEGAWKDMNSLLDQNMPKRRKWPVMLLLLPFFAIATGVGVLTYNNFESGKELKPSGHRPEINSKNLSVSKAGFKNKSNAIEPFEKQNAHSGLNTSSKYSEARTTAQNLNYEDEDLAPSPNQPQNVQQKLILPHKSISLADDNPSNSEKLPFFSEKTNSKEELNTNLTTDKRWSLKGYVGMNFTSTQASTDFSENQIHKNYSEVNKNGKSTSVGYQAGIQISYFLTPYLKLGGGLEMKKITTQNQFDYTVNEIPVIDSASGDIISYISLPQGVSYQNMEQNEYLNFAIPLSLFYAYPLNEKWSITGEWVNTAQFLLNANETNLNPTTLELESNNLGLSKTTFSYTVSVGLRYKLQENTFFAFEPGYFGLYNNLYEKDFKWKPNGGFINLSIIQRF